MLAALVILPLTIIPAFAQTTTIPCTQIGTRTEGAILVDVPQTFTDAGANDNLPRDLVGCRLLISAEAGTPLDGNQAIPDYESIVGLDVFTARASSRFEVYNPPIRVCFNATAYRLRARAAVGPDELAAGKNGPALMFSDARHVSTFQRDTDRYRGGSRNFAQLNIAADGVAVNYICADLSHPGTVNLIPQVPSYAGADPAHPNFPDSPDRCVVAGGADCAN